MTTPYWIRDTRHPSGYSEGYGPEGDRRRYDERGFFDRAGDEVRSWFGDREAERRRNRDEYETERGYRQGENWNRSYPDGEVRAGDLMTRRVNTISPRDSVGRAARMMRDCDCGSLPVVNTYGRLIGMVTDRDIAMRLVADGRDTRHAVVADCMTDRTFASHVNDNLERVAQQMARHQIRRLPVVNDDDQVIGIISQSDLARHADMYEGRGERRRFAETISEISEPSSSPYR